MTHFSDTTDVLLSVLGGESEILVQSESNVVTVEAERPLALLQQLQLERASKGRLSGGCECESSLSTELVAGRDARERGVPERPVNQTVTPFWPVSSDRCSCETPSCQTMLVATGTDMIELWRLRKLTERAVQGPRWGKFWAMARGVDNRRGRRCHVSSMRMFKRTCSSNETWLRDDPGRLLETLLGRMETVLTGARGSLATCGRCVGVSRELSWKQGAE